MDLYWRILHHRHYAAAGKENGQEPKPRARRQEKCAAAATKAKNKDKSSKQAPPFVPVRQDVSTDSDSEAEECAVLHRSRKLRRELTTVR
jgi:hypothetical protein